MHQRATPLAALGLLLLALLSGCSSQPSQDPFYANPSPLATKPTVVPIPAKTIAILADTPGRGPWSDPTDGFWVVVSRDCLCGDDAHLVAYARDGRVLSMSYTFTTNTSVPVKLNHTLQRLMQDAHPLREADGVWVNVTSSRTATLGNVDQDAVTGVLLKAILEVRDSPGYQAPSCAGCGKIRIELLQTPWQATLDGPVGRDLGPWQVLAEQMGILEAWA